jgi:hypothetical protein
VIAQWFPCSGNVVSLSSSGGWPESQIAYLLSESKFTMIFFLFFRMNCGMKPRFVCHLFLPVRRSWIAISFDAVLFEIRSASLNESQSAKHFNFEGLWMLVSEPAPLVFGPVRIHRVEESRSGLWLIPLCTLYQSQQVWQLQKMRQRHSKIRCNFLQILKTCFL